jgi:hypothetical protein
MVPGIRLPIGEPLGFTVERALADLNAHELKRWK